MSSQYPCVLMGTSVFSLFVYITDLKGKITEREERVSFQVCLEPNQVVHFSSDAFRGGGLDNLN